MKRTGSEVRVPTNVQFVAGKEREYVLDAVRSNQWAYGEYNERFSKALRDFIGTRYAILTNSGSSAALLAVSALTSPKLKDKALKPGDYVLTTALSFPTTVNAIVQNNLIPVFIDCDLDTLNYSLHSFLKTFDVYRPKAIVLTHTLGNPFDAEFIRRVCDKNQIWFIEDNCDALGSEIGGKKTGRFGHLALQSFYPAHHISTGEGGAVFTSIPILKKLVESFQSWGKDCWCPPGVDNTCGKRFEWELGLLPKGYDHKYIFSHVGYNLKMTNLQAALGTAQMEEIDFVVGERNENHWKLRSQLSFANDHFRFQYLDTENNKASWFGFAITVKESENFYADQLVYFLESRGIATRRMFAGNIPNQPAYDGKRYNWSPSGLNNTEYVANNTIWIGCYPNMINQQINHVRDTIKEFLG